MGDEKENLKKKHDWTFVFAGFKMSALFFSVFVFTSFSHRQVKRFQDGRVDGEQLSFQLDKKPRRGG